jgi:hypothetical protein
MDANGNFKVEVGIEDLEALRATIKTCNSEKNGLFSLLRQLKNGEITLEELYINGNELRIVRAPNAPATNGTTAAVPTAGDGINGSNAAEDIRGPAVPEPERELAAAGGNSKRKS